jgi:hypothetical protein
MKDRTPSREQWVKVASLLAAGDVPGATLAAGHAVTTTRLGRSTRRGDAKIHGCGDLPQGWAYLDPARRVMVLNFTIWDRFAMGSAIYRFAEQITTMTEAACLPYDVDSWQLLDELDMVEAGLDPTYWMTTTFRSSAS